MKFEVALLSTLVFIVCAQSGRHDYLTITPRFGEPKIKEIVKGIVNRLCHGVPSMGIPKLEPFQQLQPVDVKLNHSMAEFSGSFSNIYIAGLSGLEVIDVKFSTTLQFSFKFKIPKIKASAQFKLKGSLGSIPIDGNGSFDTTVSGIELNASGILKSINRISPVDLKIEPSIKNLRVNIVDLVPDKHTNDFINEVLNTRGPELLQKVWHKTGDDISRKIEKLLEPLFESVDAAELVKVILGMKPAFKPDDPPANCTPVIS